MKPQSKFVAFLASACSLASPTVNAATNTWSATPSNGLWATTGNWSLNALATSDNIVFGTSTVTTLATASRTIADLTFNSGAPSYTINGTTGSQILTLSPAATNANGIINNSTNTQTLGVNLALSTTKSYLFGTTINPGSTPSTVVTGTTYFGGNGTQNNAVIISARDVNVTLGAVQSSVGTSAVTQALVLDGNTTASKVTGVIANNTNSTTAVAKTGTGTWALSGANTYTGGTTVQNGTLKLDFAASGAPTSNILHNGVTPATVVLSGGDLLIAGKDSTANTQAFGAIQSLSNAQGGSAGYGKLILAAGTSGTMAVTVTSLSGASANSALDFYLGANTTLTNTTVSSAAMVGKYAFFGGSDYAYYTATGKVEASAGRGYGNGNVAIGAATGTNNGTFYLASGNLTRTSAMSFRGLNISSSGGTNQSLNLGGLTATANNGSILYAGGGTNNYTIENGTLSCDSSSSEVMMNVASGATLNITSAMSDNGSFLSTFGKVGDGTLVISGAKSYTGKSYVVGGTLSIDTLKNGGTSSSLGASSNAATNLTIGGTLKYTGGADSTDRSFTVGAQGATIDSSGSGALTWAPGAALVYIANSNSYAAGKTAANNTIAFTGSNTDNNTFGSASALLADGTPGQLSITKSGTGKWILNQANTYSGGTAVTAGTLVLANNSAAGTAGIALSGASSTILQINSANTIANNITVSNSGSSVVRQVTSGTGYTVGTSGNLTSSFTSATPDSTAKILASGNATSTTDLTMSFSGTSAATNDVIRRSDVFSVSGTGTDAYVLQLTASSLAADSVLGYKDGSVWNFAVAGNTGSAGTYAGNYAMSFSTFLSTYGGSFNATTMLGAYGYDSGGTSVWAVVNHGGDFAAVPEPTSALAGLLITAGLLRRRRKA